MKNYLQGIFIILCTGTVWANQMMTCSMTPHLKYKDPADPNKYKYVLRGDEASAALPTADRQSIQHSAVPVIGNYTIEVTTKDIIRDRADILTITVLPVIIPRYRSELISSHGRITGHQLSATGRPILMSGKLIDDVFTEVKNGSRAWKMEEHGDVWWVDAPVMISNPELGENVRIDFSGLYNCGAWTACSGSTCNLL